MFPWQSRGVGKILPEEGPSRELRFWSRKFHILSLDDCSRAQAQAWLCGDASAVRVSSRIAAQTECVTLSAQHQCDVPIDWRLNEGCSIDAVTNLQDGQP